MQTPVRGSAIHLDKTIYNMEEFKSKDMKESG